MSDFFPYILKSFIQWCCDNNKATVVVFKDVTEEAKEQRIEGYLNNGYLTLILNKSNQELFTITENSIDFEIRVNGKTQAVVMPFLKIVALKAFNPSTGDILFTMPITPNPTIISDKPKTVKEKIKNNHLTLVK